MKRRLGVSLLKFWNKILFMSFSSGGGGLVYLIFGLFSKPSHKNFEVLPDIAYNTFPRVQGSFVDYGVFVT